MNSSPQVLSVQPPSIPALYQELAGKLDRRQHSEIALIENTRAKIIIISLVFSYCIKILATVDREEAIRLTQVAAKEIIEKLDLKVDFHSEVSPEILESTTPKLFLANHQGGGLESLVLPGILEQLFTCVIKNGLIDLPVFGAMMRKCKAIVINRSKPDLRKNGAEIAQRLRNGENVLLFFEGTRSPDGSIGEARLLGTLEKAIKKNFTSPFYKVGVVVDTLALLPEPIEKKPFGPFRKEAGLTVRLFDAAGLHLEENRNNENDPTTLSGAFRTRLTQVLQEKLSRLSK